MSKASNKFNRLVVAKRITAAKKRESFLSLYQLSHFNLKRPMVVTSLNHTMFHATLLTRVITALVTLSDPIHSKSLSIHMLSSVSLELINKVKLA